MADNPFITSLTTGVKIAAEDVGGVEFQRVKLADGGIGSTGGIDATTGTPAAASRGLVVAVKGGASVSAQVSGTVSVSGVVQISGTVTAGAGTTVISGTVSVINGLSVSAQISGTVTVADGLSVSAVVSGTVTVAMNSTTAAPSISATGLVVWIAGGQSTTARPLIVSGLVTISGTAIVTVPSINVLSTIVTILGTQIVSVVPGLSVNALISGPVSISNVAPVTTAASVSVTALPVWLNPTQPVVVNTIAAGFSVQALVTGPVSVSAMPAVSISVSAALGTVITILGTQIVSVVPGLSVSAVVSGVVSISALPAVSLSSIVPVTTQASVSVSGLPVWLNPTQGVTILGTQVVNTIAAGFSVNALVTGVVSVSQLPSISISSIVPVTTQASVSVTGLPVWLNPTQGVTILGTQLVTNASIFNATTTAPAANASGLVVWNAGINITTGTPAAAATGQVVWVVNQATVTVTNTGQLGTGIAFYYSSVSMQTVFTQGLMAVALLGTSVQTSDYVVPAGRVLSLNGVMCRVQNTAASIAFYVAQIQVRASLSQSTTVGPIYGAAGVAAVTSGTNAVNIAMIPIRADFTGGLTVQFDVRCTGATGGISEFIVSGNLF